VNEFSKFTSRADAAGRKPATSPRPLLIRIGFRPGCRWWRARMRRSCTTHRGRLGVARSRQLRAGALPRVVGEAEDRVSRVRARRAPRQRGPCGAVRLPGARRSPPRRRLRIRPAVLRDRGQASLRRWLDGGRGDAVVRSDGGRDPGLLGSAARGQGAPRRLPRLSAHVANTGARRVPRGHGEAFKLFSISTALPKDSLIAVVIAHSLLEHADGQPSQ
jgi:hypothetical protein